MQSVIKDNGEELQKVFLNARTVNAFKVRKVELFLKLVFSGLLLFLFLLSKVLIHSSL